MIVVDTNLIVALTLPHPDAATAEAVWRRDPVWHAPWLWVSEWRNVAMKYLRRGLGTLADVEEAMGLAGEAVPEERRRQPDGALVLRIAARSGLSAYDAEFLALAELLDVPLVTWDRRLLEAAGGRAVPPEAFV